MQTSMVAVVGGGNGNGRWGKIALKKPKSLKIASFWFIKSKNFQGDWNKMQRNITWALGNTVKVSID